MIALAAGVVDAEIVLRVLIVIFGGNPIPAPLRFKCQGGIAFEYLVGRAADANVGTIAVECLRALGTSLPLGWAVSVETAARPLI
jgi:hypothetical protein